MENNYLIDTHSHIDMEDFDSDFKSMLDNATKMQVEKVIIPSVDRNSFEKVVKLSQDNDCLYFALGIHPTEAQNAKDEDFENILSIKSEKFVAIGECGLDYYWDKTFKDEQKKVFIKQIEIAKTLKKALVVHDRDAHKDTFDLLTEHTNGEIPVVMHCFSGSLEFAKECIKKGFYIGIGGVITFKNAKKLHEVAKDIPLEYLVLETDAPYLTPVPYRGKRNEPAYTRFVAEEIAKIKDISFEEVMQTTTKTARKVFGI